MRCERAGRARGVRARCAWRFAQYACQLVDADRTRPQNGGVVVSAIDDGRFDAVLTWTAVENHRDLGSEFIRDVGGGGCADASEAVGRRRSDAVTANLDKACEQSPCNRVCRHTQADAVLASRQEVRYAIGPRQDERQRPWPERIGQRRCKSGRAPCPAQQRIGGGDMNDHRMFVRPPLSGIQPPQRGGIARICAQAVHRFRRKGDQRAIAKRLCCGRNGFQRGGTHQNKTLRY